MNTYKLIWRFRSEDDLKLLNDLFQETEADLALKTLSRKLTLQAPQGRKPDSEATKRVKLWVEKRTKPFESASFEKFTGLSKPAAHRRLSRLVQTGVYAKRWVDGKVEYYRPSEG